jgi:hypothetical protein
VIFNYECSHAHKVRAVWERQKIGEVDAPLINALSSMLLLLLLLLLLLAVAVEMVAVAELSAAPAAFAPSTAACTCIWSAYFVMIWLLGD